MGICVSTQMHLCWDYDEGKLDRVMGSDTGELDGDWKGQLEYSLRILDFTFKAMKF